MSRNNRRSVLRSRFGPYGGRYVPEMLVPALEELESAYLTFRKDREFLREWNLLLKRYVGRPTPLYFAENLTRSGGGARIYLKLEGLAHTGAHKINNVLGQVLLARRMGKRRIVAETGAGQHGLATAAACAKFGLPCTIFMGEHDMRRQQPNVFTMKLHGAEVVPVAEGTRTLKDAVNAAFKHWVENLAETHYLLGSALGPHPYPTIVRDFQSIIGREVKSQIREYEGRLPDMLVACVGGGSNAMGLFAPFLKDTGVACIGVEAGGRSSAAGEHAVRFGADGKTGIVQGYKSIFLQDGDGQILPTHSVSAGLDYAGVGPQIAHLHDTGRISLVSATDEEALGGLKRLAEEEGILPALESSHAAAYALKKAAACAETDIMVINISGRGEKDLFITARALDREGWLEFLKRETERD